MRGILFKPDMIKAIVEGRKTQTRRVIKPQLSHFDVSILEALGKEARWTGSNRYKVGEVVYIKEAWAEGKRLCDYIRHTGVVTPIYKLDIESSYWQAYDWKLPLFMPAWAARYFIKITGVRPERLQAITEEDAEAEGINPGIKEHDSSIDLRLKYASLWDSINKPPYDWQSNPYVWVYSFERSLAPEP